MENTNEETKKIITGILTSTPLQMSVHQLKKDYYDIVGQDIPYQKLGFRSLHDYLQSIPDVVKVIGNGPHAKLEMVVTSKSAHITKLISKQKVVVKKRSRQKRNSYHYEEQYRKNIKKFENLHINPKSHSNEVRVEPSCSYSLPNKSEKKLTNNSNNEAHMGITNEIFKDIRNQYNERIPYKVQQNIKALVSEQKNGIWCAEIPTAYMKRFREKLDFTDYGYNSLVQLCSDLGDCFNYFKPGKGDVMIFDKSVPINGAVPQLDSPSFTKSFDNMIQGKTSDALPPQIHAILDEYYSYKCPKDIVKFGDTLETISVSKFKEKDCIVVKVAEIYDPSKFWIIIKSEDCYDKLEQLMDEMQNFYVQNTDYCIPSCLLKLGTYCAAIICNEYHRGIIVGIVNNNPENVKIFFVDYGTVAIMPSKGICFLHKNFFDLPQQAIRSRLYGIYPRTTDTQWSINASQRLLQLVQNKDLCAEIQRVDTTRNALEIVLADTTTDVDIFINDALVNENLAIFTYQEQEVIVSQFKPKVKYIHLFPTFREIELGLVPSSYEMLLLKNVDLHTIYPNYYESIHVREIDVDEDNVPDVEFHVRRPKGCLSRYDENAIDCDDARSQTVANDNVIKRTNCFDDLHRLPKTRRVELEERRKASSPITDDLPLCTQDRSQTSDNLQTGHLYPNPNMRHMQVPKIMHKIQMTNLNTQLNDCVLMDQDDYNNLTTNNKELNHSDTYIKSKNIVKYVTIHDFCDNILHVVNLNKEKYMLMTEVIKRFLGWKFTIITIRRILARGHSVNLLSLNANSNKELKIEMLRLKLLHPDEDIIHLLHCRDLPKLMETLNLDFLDKEEYETFLLNIN